jgi:membrane-associated phospholipid phosphatase
MPALWREFLSEAKVVDTAIYGAVAAAKTPRLDRAMRALTRSADHGTIWLGAAGIMALVGGSEGRTAARRGLFSLAIGSATSNLIGKPLTARRRPERQELEELAARHVPMPRSSSFPSAHTASAFAFATGAAAAYQPASAPLRAMATLVGYSRVHTGVHYPADVLAGAFLGVSAAELASRLLGD